MSRVVVVGSGASGIHFAVTALDRGHEVVLLDVARQPREPVVRPDDALETLKETLPDPAAYFLGSDFDGVLFPDTDVEYYGFPPHKSYIFDGTAGLRMRATGFEPLVSFARGGLAEAWTGGVYPFNDGELIDFPIGYRDLAPHYEEVARRIGINGEADDLSRFYPVHDHLMPGVPLDSHSERLLRTYAGRRERLNAHGCFLGRSRVATLSRAAGGRSPCSQCGRCLWGCPSGAFYTPALTLRECLGRPGFEYHPGAFVTHVALHDGGRAAGVVATTTNGGAPIRVDGDIVVLAAGTLSTARIFLETAYRAWGEIVRLEGLMDNQQVLVPFLNLGMLGGVYEPESYQYHQVALGIEAADPRDYVHGQITTLTTALVHPLLHRIPGDLRTSIHVFRAVRSALGLLNLNFSDTRRRDSFVTLEPDAGGHRMVISYAPGQDEPGRFTPAIRAAKRGLRALGCIVPPGGAQLRPKGASVHYAGTIPMSERRAPLSASPQCESYDVPGLFFVDGTTYPFLPAKNITFTLMANAVRVADAIL